MKTRVVRWHACFPQGRAFNAIVVRMTPQRVMTLHAHDFAEVFWIHQGQAIHTINGQEQEMQTGDLTMIRPCLDKHDFLSQTREFSIFNVAFPMTQLADIKRRYFDSFAFWGGTAGQPELYHLTEIEQQWLNAAGYALLHAPQARLLLDRFLLNLLCSISEGQSDLFRACPGWLKKACEAIRSPANFAGGVKCFFNLAQRSPEHVSRTLKKHTGKTPGEVVNAVRLEYAAGQLLTTTRDILELSLDCGYNSLSHFYMLFHKKYGMSPRRYRLTFFKAPAQIIFPAGEHK